MTHTPCFDDMIYLIQSHYWGRRVSMRDYLPCLVILDDFSSLVLFFAMYNGVERAVLRGPTKESPLYQRDRVCICPGISETPKVSL